MNWLRACLTENVGLKLWSLALALAIWSTFGGDPVTEATVRVPVEYHNVPDRLELLPALNEVQLRVRGPSRALRRAVPGDFSVRVDLSPSKEPGERTFVFRTDAIQTPTFLKVVQVIPAQIQFALEQTITKQVPVHPQFFGKVASPQRIKNYRVRPSHVRIAGPSSHVEPMQAVMTDAVELTGLRASKTILTAVSIQDPLVRLVDSPTVEITIELQKAD
ncbi:MAG: YbbR-like domain-containing protein [Acidobacteria bacterium]|nr:YbbR-like domain-containing protein [Acidobacteriota bacterium]